MLDSFYPNSQTPYYSSILPLVFVDATPCALIAKAKNNQ